MESDATQDGSDGEPEVAVCPMCLGENSPLAVRCVQCGAFSTGRSATLPFEASFAHAWALGEVVSRKRPTLVLLVGAWLLLLPTILNALLPTLGGGLGTGESGGSPDAVASALVAAVCVFLLARTTRNYARGRRTVPPPTEDGEPGPGEA